MQSTGGSRGDVPGSCYGRKNSLQEQLQLPLHNPSCDPRHGQRRDADGAQSWFDEMQRAGLKVPSSGPGPFGLSLS